MRNVRSEGFIIAKFDLPLSSLAGARIRLVSLSQGQRLIGIVHSYRDPLFLVFFENLEELPTAGDYIVEGFCESAHVSFVGHLQMVDASSASLRPAQQPNVRRMGFHGEFARNPINAELERNGLTQTCPILGFGPNQFIIDLDAPIEKGETVLLRLPEERHPLEYPAVVQSCIPHGHRYLVQAAFGDVSRLASIYWNKLAKAA